MTKIHGNTYPDGAPCGTPVCLNQKFYYLGRGLQSFVFESEDRTVVLKLFNNRLQRQIFWLALLPPSAWRESQLASRRRKLDAALASYRIAFEDLREETALLYLHPGSTAALHRPVILVDKLGIEHALDLNSCGFLLQKKAQLVFPFLESLRGAHDAEGAQRALSALLSLLRAKFARGIADNDPLIRTNFGFVEGRPVQIDVGPFSKDSSVRNPLFYKKEYARITASLRAWAAQHYPEISSYLDQEVERMLSSPP
jgi:hypothetical protein